MPVQEEEGGRGGTLGARPKETVRQSERVRAQVNLLAPAFSALTKACAHYRHSHYATVSWRRYIIPTMPPLHNPGTPTRLGGRVYVYRVESQQGVV